MSSTRTEIRHQYRQPLDTTHILVVACLCSIIIFVMMSICLMSSYWFTAEGFRQGLLYLCIEEAEVNSRFRSEPLPFDMNKDEMEPGCYPNRDKFYLKMCVFLCLITQLSALASACLSGFTIRTKNAQRLLCMRLSITTILLSLICDLSLMIYYYVEFSDELDQSNRSVWELNVAFGLACGSAILALGTMSLSLVALHRIKVNLHDVPTHI